MESKEALNKIKKFSLGIKPKWQQQVIDSTHNLIRKRLVPEEYNHVLSDPSVLNAMIHNFQKEAFSEWSCPNCNISVYGPKKLLLAHHKQCLGVYQDKMKENEGLTSRFKIYR